MSFDAILRKLSFSELSSVRSGGYSDLIKSYLSDDMDFVSEELKDAAALEKLVNIVVHDIKTDDKQMLVKVLNVISWLTSCVWFSDNSTSGSTSIATNRPELYNTLVKLAVVFPEVIASLHSSHEPLVLLSLFIIEKQSLPILIAPHLPSIMNFITTTIIDQCTSFPSSSAESDAMTRTGTGGIASSRYKMSLKALHTICAQSEQRNINESTQSTNICRLVTPELCAVMFGLLMGQIGQQANVVSTGEEEELAFIAAIRVLLIAPPDCLLPLLPMVYEHAAKVADYVRCVVSLCMSLQFGLPYRFYSSTVRVGFKSQPPRQRPPITRAATRVVKSSGTSLWTVQTQLRAVRLCPWWRCGESGSAFCLCCYARKHTQATM